MLCLVQNPDEPEKKPTLQTYTVDLNQCGPMVSPLYLLSRMPSTNMSALLADPGCAHQD